MRRLSQLKWVSSVSSSGVRSPVTLRRCQRIHLVSPASRSLVVESARQVSQCPEWAGGYGSAGNRLSGLHLVSFSMPPGHFANAARP
jgi:hypothetical protein